MRSRTNSSTRLDAISHLLHRTVLNKMDEVTGLLKSNYPGLEEHVWVRDNVYAIHSIWALSKAYRNHSDAYSDLVQAYELEQICVRVMRSLMECMMRQVHKVEMFKVTQNRSDCLHAKYHSRTLDTVHGDFDWGHLQLDATSLYLLTLAQLTASGLSIPSLQVIWNLDEVAFIQNLVYYIEEAYRIPDFGIWERGDKRNQGVPELNATSIGMAKAALEALDGLDLFGAHGAAPSVMHVPPDAIRHSNAVLESLLPRESISKETDAGLLTVIGYPAFAVEDPDIIDATRKAILDKLGGRYGCRRFLRDGYKTPREDQSRLYYEPWELAGFEGIECEWPLFTCYLMLDALFAEDRNMIHEMREELSEVILHTEDHLELVPELYALPADKVEAELKQPRSQERVPGGHTPFVWAQSLYIITRLIDEKFIKPSELDPLNRRLSTEKRPQTVVQVAVIAEDSEVKSLLISGAGLGSSVETLSEVADRYIIEPSTSLGRIWHQVGKMDKMGLSGRPDREVGLLSTSKLYSIQDRILIFMPQFLDSSRFYLIHDMKIMNDLIKMELAYLASTWTLLGRPLLLLKVTRNLVLPNEETDISKKLTRSVLGMLRRLKAGHIGETKIRVGRLSELESTSCVTDLDFLFTGDSFTEDAEFGEFLSALLREAPDCVSEHSFLPGSPTRAPLKRLESMDESRKQSTMTMVKSLSTRHRSILLQGSEAELIRMRMPLLRLASNSTVTDPDDNDDINASSPDIHISIADDMGLSETTSNGEMTPTRAHSPMSIVASYPNLLRSDGASTPPAEGLTASRSSRMDLEMLEEVTCEELAEMLSLTESVEEQGDLLYFMWLKKGPEYVVHLGERSVNVSGLFEEAYSRACRERVWWLVRLGAGLLEKKVDELARALGDLLVRQKQVTVGLPGPMETILDTPLPTIQIQALIRKACGDDVNSAMLTQEILVYLGIFVRTEPALFQEMLRLRLGLIIGLMASELERGRLIGEGETPTSTLLNLSPYDVKTLLFNILSGKEIEAILPEALPQSEMEERKIRNFNHFVNKSMRAPKKEFTRVILHTLT